MLGSRIRDALVGWAALATILVAVALVVATVGTPQLERTVTDFLLVAALVVALQTFVGNSGIVSFGHVSFAGIGAYVTALVTIPVTLKESALPDLPAWLAGTELGLLPAVVLSIAIAAVVAAVVGGAMARMSEMGFAMATLALLVLTHAVLANWDSVTRGGYGIFGIPSNTTLWSALAGLLSVAFVARLYRASRLGLRLQATREDPVSSRSVAVNVAGARFGSLVLSAALMGAGGSLLAQHLLAFDPDQFFFALTFSTLAMLVIGGRESVTGAVAGAATVAVASDVLRQAEQGFSIGPLDVPELPGLVQLVVAALIVLVLVVRPAGMFGRSELEDVAERLVPRLRRRPEAAEPADVRARPSRAVHGADRDGSALAVRDVVMSFQGVRALNGVSLAVAPGEILGLIGPNGSGKTTLVNVASGLYAPTSGAVRLGEREVTGWPAHRVAELGLARTFQNVRLFRGLTVRENLLAAAPRGGAEEREVERLLALFDLVPHADTPAGELAYGAQRRVEAARATIRRPSVLLLDEPAAGMNEVESDNLLKTISSVRDELGCAVVVIDHDLRLILRLSERVHVLNEGETIAEGAPEAVGRDPRVVNAYLGTARETDAREDRASPP